MEQYDSLQGVIDHADEIGGKIGENLREAIDRLPLSYELATIKLDCDLEFKPDELNIANPDLKELKKLYGEMEFKRWLTEVLKDLGEGDETSQDNESGSGVALVDRSKYETILEQQDLDKWIKKLKEVELFAFDTETTSLNYIEAELVGMSFGLDNGEAAYLPLAHSYMGAPKQLDRDNVLKKLKPLLESEKHKKWGRT